MEEGIIQKTKKEVHRGVLELPSNWPSGSKLPPVTPSKPAGKLGTPDTVDLVSGGENLEVQPPMQISPITGGYRLPGSINGTSITLLLDTGAAVTLLRQDVWMRIAALPSDLEPWSGATLVSAGGTPLTD